MEGLKEREILEIREMLDNCHRPLFLFHDDADGLSSFVLLYKYVNEGKGIIIKTSPELGPSFTRYIEEYGPDIVFILDKPKVSQEFFDTAKVKVVWIDHHGPMNPKNVIYYNSRLNGNNLPVSFISYQITKEDLWIAMAGVVGDWHLPESMRKEFNEKYPDLLPKEITEPDKALFKSKIGKLAKIFNFCMKSDNRIALKCAKILTRIKDPNEILEQTTAQGKYIYKKFRKMNDEYERLLDEAMSSKVEDNVLLYIYTHSKVSLTSDLSNEVLFNHPDKVIIVARDKNGEMKMSLRSSKHELNKIVEKALEGVEGYGGGHEHACGANVKKEDFEKFLNSIKEQIK